MRFALEDSVREAREQDEFDPDAETSLIDDERAARANAVRNRANAKA